VVGIQCQRGGARQEGVCRGSAIAAEGSAGTARYGVDLSIAGDFPTADASLM
jgi:hypothetical protein